MSDMSNDVRYALACRSDAIGDSYESTRQAKAYRT